MRTEDRSPRARRHRPALDLKHLEDRAVPANLSITDFTLLDVNGIPTAGSRKRSG